MRTITVNDFMQQGYVYNLTGRTGVRPGFSPELTPEEMLELGVFGGKYMTDCRDEFPAGWFERAKLVSERHDPELNFFGVMHPAAVGLAGTRAGSIPRILAAGFSGTAATTSAAAAPTTRARSSAGGRSAATSPRSTNTASPATSPAAASQRQALLHWAYDWRLI